MDAQLDHVNENHIDKIPLDGSLGYASCAIVIKSKFPNTGKDNQNAGVAIVALTAKLRSTFGHMITNSAYFSAMFRSSGYRMGAFIVTFPKGLCPYISRLDGVLKMVADNATTYEATIENYEVSTKAKEDKTFCWGLIHLPPGCLDADDVIFDAARTVLRAAGCVDPTFTFCTDKYSLRNGKINFQFKINSSTDILRDRFKTFGQVLLPSGAYMRMRPSNEFIDNFKLTKCCLAGEINKCVCSNSTFSAGSRKRDRESARGRLAALQY